MTTYNNNEDSLIFLFDFLKSLLTKEELKEFLSAKGRSSCLALHVAFMRSTPEVANLFLNFYQTFFNKEEIFEFSSLRESQSYLNIFEIAASKSDEMLEVIAIFIE